MKLFYTQMQHFTGVCKCSEEFPKNLRKTPAMAFLLYKSVDQIFQSFRTVFNLWLTISVCDQFHYNKFSIHFDTVYINIQE